MAVLFVVVLIGVLGSVSLESLKTGTPRNNVLEQQVLGLLEDFRQLMLTGSDDIPILDPLEIERLHLDENTVDLPGSHLTITELLVKHASTFVVDRLSITITSILLQQYSVEIEAHIPVLDVEFGEYDLHVTALGFTLFGRGDGKIQMVQPYLTATFTFSLWTISVSNTVVHFGLGGFESQLNGLFHHDGASDFANSFLSNLVPELVDFFEEDISALLSTLVQDLANLLLEDVSIGDLFPQVYRLPTPTEIKTK